MSVRSTILSNETQNYLDSDADYPYLETPNKIGRLYVYSSQQLSFQEKKYPLITNWEDSYKTVLWTNPAPTTAVAFNNPNRLFMETGGNLTFRNGSNVVIWSTNTSGQGVGPYTFELKNSGEMVVKDSRNTVLWSSQTFFTFYLVNDARLVGYFNPGVFSGYDYTNKESTNKTIKNIKNLSSTTSKATIEGSFAGTGDFVIRLNNTSDGSGNMSSGLSVSTGGVSYKTISFWVYIHDLATETAPTCLIDIPGVGSITSQLGVSSSLQTGFCMIDGGTIQGLTLSFSSFQKKGSWTNITLTLSQAVNTNFILFNNQNFLAGMNCSFGPVLVYNSNITDSDNFANYYFFRKYFTPLTVPIPLPFELDRVKYVHADSAYDTLPFTYFGGESRVETKTPEDCRQLALADQSKYVGWLHINDKHPTASLRNSCKLLKKSAVIDDDGGLASLSFVKNYPFGNTPSIQDNIYTSGCSKIGQRPEWACKSMPSSIDYKSGFSSATAIEEITGNGKTPNDCRALASANSKYKAWAYGTMNHADNSKRNTCVLYTEEIKPFTTDYKVDNYISGCINPNELLSLGCKVPPPTPTPPTPTPPTPTPTPSNPAASTTTNSSGAEIINESDDQQTGQEYSTSNVSTSVRRVVDNSSLTKSTTASSGYDWKTILKWVGIGLGSFIGLVVIIVVAVLASRSNKKDGPLYNVHGLTKKE